MTMRFKCSGILLLLCACMISATTGRVDARQPTAKQILANAAKTYDTVKDYVVDARLAVDSQAVHVPDMRIKVYYKQPDKLHIDSEDGFAVLPKQGVIVGNPVREISNGSAILIQSAEQLDGRDCYVLKVSSVREGRAVQSTVWIDKKNWLVRQMNANPEWGPSVQVKLWYSKVGGRYWLPVVSSAKVSLPPLPEYKSAEKPSRAQPMIVTIKFSNYRVNKGIKDNVFRTQRG